jgi:Tol biopolymer transport system component
MSRRFVMALTALLLAMGVGPAGAATSGGATERVSVSSEGAQANDFSEFATISADGRFVSFYSFATNLVADDTNDTSDIFLRDRESGTIERVSVSGDDAQANSPSYLSAVSADGRFVAFESYASNLVAGDTNGWPDVFVRDRVAGTTERVNVSSGGAQADQSSQFSAISADGRFVAFWSYATNLVAGDTNNVGAVFVRDRVAGTTERVSVSGGGAQGNSDSFDPEISGDGRIVVFASGASNLVAGDTNNVGDVFIRDRVAGTTTRGDVSSGGAQANEGGGEAAVSADGRFIAFSSRASNLVAGDTNGQFDVFVRDLVAGTTQRVNVSGGGAQANEDSSDPEFSADGRFVLFLSWASNLVAGDTN